MRLEADGESGSARPDHPADDHPFHSNPIPIMCARRRSTVAAHLVDLVMAVGITGKKWAELRSRCEHDGISRVLPSTARCNPQPTPSGHARGPHPRPHCLPSRVRCRCVVPQASILPGDEGCARCTWGLKEMVGILEISVLRSARASVKIFAEEVAGRSEGVASVRGDSAAIAGRARVGTGKRVCMMCGPSRDVVGRCIRLDTDVNS